MLRAVVLQHSCLTTGCALQAPHCRAIFSLLAVLDKQLIVFCAWPVVLWQEWVAIVFPLLAVIIVATIAAAVVLAKQRSGSYEMDTVEPFQENGAFHEVKNTHTHRHTHHHH